MEFEYPTFSLDGDGNLSSDMPGYTGTVSAGDAFEDSPFYPGASPSPSPDVPAAVLADSGVMEEIQAELERIANAQASTAGYLSSSALDTFDRVVGGYGYDYYCAFRYDSDSYNAQMYLSDGIVSSGSSVVMEDSVLVRLYRTYHSSDRTYTYHYSISSAGDVSVSLANGLMYYTNVKDNYPTLGGEPSPGRYPHWFVPFCGVLFVLVLIIFLRGRRP